MIYAIIDAQTGFIVDSHGDLEDDREVFFPYVKKQLNQTFKHGDQVNLETFQLVQQQIIPIQGQ
jgi:hypothetical protein